MFMEVIMKKRNSVSYLAITILNIIITLAEFIGGFASGSLSLLSDAVHNLSDVRSIVLAYIANLISNSKQNSTKTFGYKRAEIIAAFINGLVLIGISIYLFIEAIGRFSNPQPIQGQVMFIVSLIGLLTNFISMIIMIKKAKNNLNAKAMFLNMASDTLSSVAVVIGSIVISIWNITIIDPVLTMLAAIVLFGEAIKVTKKASDILMESNLNIDIEQVKMNILTFKEVKDVHHLHIWQYSDEVIMLEAHLNVNSDISVTELEDLYSKIERSLVNKFEIRHTTFQVECNQKEDQEISALNA